MYYSVFEIAYNRKLTKDEMTRKLIYNSPYLGKLFVDKAKATAYARERRAIQADKDQYSRSYGYNIRFVVRKVDENGHIPNITERDWKSSFEPTIIE
jgi:hypothetical protein